LLVALLGVYLGGRGDFGFHDESEMSSLIVAGSVPESLAPVIEIRIQPTVTVYRDLPGTQATAELPPAQKGFANASSVDFGQLAATVSSHARTADLNPLNTTTGPRLLTLEEAAARLNVSLKKLRRLCREQKITHQRVDYRNYRFQARDLDEFEKAKTFKRTGAFRG
jgi:excisionase family DNA binding protein